MATGFFKVPTAVNEPVLSYAPGTRERELLKNAIQEARSEEVDVPMIIDGKEVRTDNPVPIYPPHDLKHLLGHYHNKKYYYNNFYCLLPLLNNYLLLIL